MGVWVRDADKTQFVPKKSTILKRAETLKNDHYVIEATEHDIPNNRWKLFKKNCFFFIKSASFKSA